MQRFANEAGKQSIYATFQGEQSQKREELNEKAFVDIKSMIS